MNVLITNSVPSNGGDEAILCALVASLRKRWPDSHVTVLCRDLEQCRRHLPEFQLTSALEFAGTDQEWNEAVELYRRAAMVLAAPGGLLNDFYRIENRLGGLESAADFGKPVVILAQ